MDCGVYVYRDTLKERLRAQSQGTRADAEHSHNPDAEVKLALPQIW